MVFVYHYGKQLFGSIAIGLVAWRQNGDGNHWRLVGLDGRIDPSGLALWVAVPKPSLGVNKGLGRASA